MPGRNACVRAATCSPACGAGYGCKKVGGSWMCLQNTCIPGCSSGEQCKKVRLTWTCAQLRKPRTRRNKNRLPGRKAF